MQFWLKPKKSFPEKPLVEAKGNSTQKNTLGL